MVMSFHHGPPSRNADAVFLTKGNDFGFHGSVVCPAVSGK
jgi:hypothetical protein